MKTLPVRITSEGKVTFTLLQTFCSRGDDVKTAIIQCADQGPVESLAVMLRSVGYECLLPDEDLLAYLRKIGCDTVLSPHDLNRQMGYELPEPSLFGNARPWSMDSCDLYVDVKGHRNAPRVWKRWPRLRGKTLWYRINGGNPEHVVRKCTKCGGEGRILPVTATHLILSYYPCDVCKGTGIGEDCGDEVNPPCPVLTPNQWYSSCINDTNGDGNCGRKGCYCDGRTYTCWPPFHRFEEYGPRGVNPNGYPICLIHNLPGWGYGALVEPMRRLGVWMHGVGSPDGLIDHSRIPYLLQGALAYVHLKSSDAPGYALYEALASGCPVICTRRLIWRCRMQDLLIPGKTCLVFDRETHDPLTPLDVEQCTLEVSRHLQDLRHPLENRRIGEAGRERLKKVMWSADRKSDVDDLWAFMRSNFGD